MDEHIQKTIADYQAMIAAEESLIRDRKRVVNDLCQTAGVPLLYPDVALPHQAGVSTIRGDQFYMRPLATCVKEILDMRKSSNLGPATIYEIFDALKAGNYQYVGEVEDARRGVAISIAKNTAMFHRLPDEKIGLSAWYDLKKTDDKLKPAHTARTKNKTTRRNEAAKPHSTPVVEKSEAPNGSEDKSLGHANIVFEDSIFKIIEDKFTGQFKTTELLETVGKEKPELEGHRSEISFALAGLLHRKKVRRIQKGAGKRPGIYCKV